MALSSDMQYFAATDVGRRRIHNEDNYLVDKNMGLCIVADGMGGHAAGEIASAIAVRTVHKVLREHAAMLRDRAEHGPRSQVTVKAILEILEFAVQTASAKIHAAAQQDPKKRGMGTTLSALLVLDSYGYVAHVGDSRIYLEREGNIHQVTEDHTVANELLRLGMVEPANLARIPQKNAITRAVGVYAHTDVDTLTIEVLPRDQFLLASDGLTSYLDDTDEILGPLGSPDGDEVVKAFIDFANARGGKDNITCVLMRVGRGDAEESRRARRLALKREVLAHVPLFSRLTERELLKVLHVADIVDYGPGDVVVREGERGDKLYITLSGRLRVSTGKAVLREISSGEHLGEMALIRSVPRSATVVALEQSELITLNRRDFFEIIRSEPQIAAKLLWQFVGVLAERLEQTSRDLSRARQASPDRDSAEQAVADTEEPLQEDPFSQPVPPQLGSLRLGYPPGGRDSDAGAEPSPEPPDALLASQPAPSEPPPPLAHAVMSRPQPTIPLEPQQSQDTKSTLPDGLQRGAEKVNATLPAGAAPTPPTMSSAEQQKPTLPIHERPSQREAADGAAAPSAQGARSGNTDPVPASDGAGPTAAAEADTDDADHDLDLKATIPLGGRARRGPGDGPDPSDPLAGLRGEIDKLREEFRERLRKAREERATDGKDEKKPE